MDDIEKSVLRRRRAHLIDKLQLTDDLLQDLQGRQLIGQETVKDIMASFLFTVYTHMAQPAICIFCFCFHWLTVHCHFKH